jgi:hypothetical protein
MYNGIRKNLSDPRSPLAKLEVNLTIKETVKSMYCLQVHIVSSSVG